MAKIYSIDGVIPVVDPSSFVHPDAIIIGDVIIGRECYIGPAACLRGDFGRIVIGDKANIQDTCVLHSFPDREVTVEEGGHIGHGAVLHGCHVGKNALVGMNSVVMDGATIGENAFVAAMAFVKANFSVPANSLAAGMPAKVVRELSEQEILWKTNGTGEYQQLAQRSMASMVAVTPLTEVEAQRPRIQARPSRALHETKRDS